MRQCSSSYRMSGIDRRTNVDVQILSAASKAIAEKCFWNACKALSFGLFLMAVGAIMAIIGMYIYCLLNKSNENHKIIYLVIHVCRLLYNFLFSKEFFKKGIEKIYIFKNPYTKKFTLKKLHCKKNTIPNFT